jgi:hypothetical protein
VCELDHTASPRIVLFLTSLPRLEPVANDGFFFGGLTGCAASGCEIGRILVFDDKIGVRCTSYSYQYAYRPTAYIFTNSYAIKSCINGNWFDAGPIR